MTTSCYSFLFKKTLLRPVVFSIATTYLINSITAEEKLECKSSNKPFSTFVKPKEQEKNLEKIGEAIPNNKGIFWSIEKKDMAPSYLFGTIHLTDPRVLSIPPKVQSIYDKMQTIVVESDEITHGKSITALLQTKPELVMLTKQETIKALLPSEMLNILQENLKKRDSTLESINHFKPWILKSIITTPVCDFIRQTHGVAFLDKKLAMEALNSGKQLKGLETLEEQLSSMAAILLHIHLDMLIDALKKSNDIDNMIVELYLKGETGMIMAKAKADIPEHSNQEKDYKAYEEKIIIERNQRMVEKSLPILQKGNAFIALGALHLPGQKGFIELLRQQGFIVTAVQ